MASACNVHRLHGGGDQPEADRRPRLPHPDLLQRHLPEQPRHEAADHGVPGHSEAQVSPESFGVTSTLSSPTLQKYLRVCVHCIHVDGVRQTALSLSLSARQGEEGGGFSVRYSVTEQATPTLQHWPQDQGDCH